MKDKMKELYKLTHSYLSYVSTTGNECAMTDRIVEETIKKAKELEKEYKKFMKKLRGDDK